MDTAEPARAAPALPPAAVELPDLLAWLRDFEAKRGRPLRVLHVGNIANNAFLNAKFLRSAGVDAHVLSYDYMHVMGTPEWEEVEITRDHGDDYLPRFSPDDLGAYRRPDWFVSGTVPACVLQVRSLFRGSPSLPRKIAAYVYGRLVVSVIRNFGPRAGDILQLAITRPRAFPLVVARWVNSRLVKHIGLSKFLDRAIKRAMIRARDAKMLTRLVADYDAAFPGRADRLTADDIVPFLTHVDRFRELFRHYDVVQCYSTDPLHALLAGTRPYVAFEHGTLRDFTMGDVPLHRLTALAYRKADHAFITNGDCLAYAEKLGIAEFSPIVHPVDVDQHRRDFGDDIRRLRREFDADVVLFCPVRHDWEIKGVDVHLRALPLIKARVGGGVKLVLIRWGAEVARSEALLAELGCAADAVWRPSMCRITMIKNIQAADVVLDQMALPHFGATAPQAMAAGTPVVSSYVPESTRWIIPEPAPILPAFTPDEVANAIARALDPGWRADYKKRAQRWIDAYHCPNNVIRDHLKVYRRILEHDRQGRQA